VYLISPYEPITVKRSRRLSYDGILVARFHSATVVVNEYTLECDKRY